MGDNLDKYVPEFDEEEARNKLIGLSREQLVDMLVYSYKLRRVVEKWAEEDAAKLKKIGEIIAAPSRIPEMPGIPTAEDLRRMIEEDENGTA
jgi:hypothetical protein